MSNTSLIFYRRLILLLLSFHNLAKINSTIFSSGNNKTTINQNVNLTNASLYKKCSNLICRKFRYAHKNQENEKYFVNYVVNLMDGRLTIDTDVDIELSKYDKKLISLLLWVVALSKKEVAAKYNQEDLLLLSEQVAGVLLYRKHNAKKKIIKKMKLKGEILKKIEHILKSTKVINFKDNNIFFETFGFKPARGDISLFKLLRMVYRTVVTDEEQESKEELFTCFEACKNTFISNIDPKSILNNISEDNSREKEQPINLNNSLSKNSINLTENNELNNNKFNSNDFNNKNTEASYRKKHLSVNEINYKSKPLNNQTNNTKKVAINSFEHIDFDNFL